MTSALSVELDVNFSPEDLVRWYHDESDSDMLIIMIRACPVRISRFPRAYVYWSPEGGSGMMEPLEKAIRRLQTLQETKRPAPRVTCYIDDAKDVQQTVTVSSGTGQ